MGLVWSEYRVSQKIYYFNAARAMVGAQAQSPVHNVHFVKYDVTVSFDDAVSDTIRRRGGDRGIFTEEGGDTVAYFGGNHGFRV